MTKAILICWHKYTPFGDEFYEPMLNNFIHTLSKFADEYDHVYLIDSTWNIDPKRVEDLKATIVKVNTSLRYYDAYKEVLPQVKEELVFLMDNDTVIWKKGIIDQVFTLLNARLKRPGVDQPLVDVVSVLENIGTYKTSKLFGKNKFCPYWFATRKELLIKYLDIDWGSHMPHSETLGLLTEAMLNDDVKSMEWPEDKSSIYFDGSTAYEQDHVEGGRGYYPHIRAGSTPAYLMATKKYGDKKTYDDWLDNQPTGELLRQIAWYWSMFDVDTGHPPFELMDMLDDLNIDVDHWNDYLTKFEKYHGLT